MKLTIIGTGYVGLVTGTCLAEVGHDVVCFDTDKKKIALLNAGGIPIHEPGLSALVKKNVEAGRLKFTDDQTYATNFGAAQFIAVGTPPDEDGSADLQYVLDAVRKIGQGMQGYKLIIDKSTVPVGTAEKVKKAIREELQKRNVEFEFSVVSNPEFLREGAAIKDFLEPDRVVIGADNEAAFALMREIYAPLCDKEKIVETDLKSAELIKYASNSMLATRISFMNELAMLAEKVGADIENVKMGMGADKRIGTQFLNAGCGYGGSCFPKDVKALIHTAKTDAGMELKILSAVEEVNEQQKHVLTEKIVRHFGGDLSGKHFALWGLAFKPDTDDMREAPSITLLKDLFARGAEVTAYDPVATNEAKRIFGRNPKLHFAENHLSALKAKDALIVVTEWAEFHNYKFSETYITNYYKAIKNMLGQPVIFDGRNLFDKKTMADAGIEYYSIGR